MIVETVDRARPNVVGKRPADAAGAAGANDIQRLGRTSGSITPPMTASAVARVSECRRLALTVTGQPRTGTRGSDHARDESWTSGHQGDRKQQPGRQCSREASDDLTLDTRSQHRPAAGDLR